MDFNEKLKASVIILIIVLFCGFIGACFLPKAHLGYYFHVKDGINGSQIYPIYQVYNNWAYYPDRIAYESMSVSDCYEMFIKLKGE